MKAKLQAHQTKRQEVEDKIESLQSEIQALESQGNDSTTATTATTAAGSSTNATSAIPEATPADFSKFSDENGYNGRFFSTYYVEHVLNSYFETQKLGMKSRVCGLGGEVLCMDFQYKTANRVKVYFNGKPFSPWHCMASSLNEDVMTIWWGFLKGAESFSEIEPQLRDLKKRLDRIQGPDH